MAVDFIKPTKDNQSLLMKKRGFDFYKPLPLAPSAESLNAKLAEEQAQLEKEKLLFLKEKESFENQSKLEAPSEEIAPKKVIRRRKVNELS
jgi:hypothetical protein